MGHGAGVPQPLRRLRSRDGRKLYGRHTGRECCGVHVQLRRAGKSARTAGIAEPRERRRRRGDGTEDENTIEWKGNLKSLIVIPRWRIY